MRAALVSVGLDKFLGRLNESSNWSQILSGGEQQKLALARALLQRPDWLFLDEATSALDEATEASLYSTLRRELPLAAIVSIAHRTVLMSVHDRALTVGGGRQ